VTDLDVTRPDRDLAKGHPLLQARWPVLLERLVAEGFPMMVNEVYRPELRQQWLYGAGRSAFQLAGQGISAAFARPAEPRVTNAWSAKLSAHGWTIANVPAAAALDVVPVGADGKPWSRDDPWDAFVALLARIGPSHGLVHFHSPGKGVWDRPHLQLVEWSDRDHRVILPPPKETA
jgi:hypothetical protein